MKKATASFLIFFTAFYFAVPATQVEARIPVSISAPSAVLLDAATNRVVYSKSPRQRRAPASTTKILTAMVAMDQLSLDHVVTIPAFAEGIEPSKAYLRGGEQYTVRDLVRATLISSANDAAEVLAHAAGGSRSEFAKLMNKKARSIGARNSNFIRASGLPAKGQTTTAYDMALVVKHAQQYSFIVQTLKEKTRTIHSRAGRRIHLRNHNKMLWRVGDDVVGKTGWTRLARHCFVGHLDVNQRKVMISVLGSHSLWRDIRKLLDYQMGSSYKRVKQNRKIWSTHEVRRIQTALRKAGYNPGPVDGKFGPRTLRATERFQKANGLQVDGIVGSLTWKKLSAYL